MRPARIIVGLGLFCATVAAIFFFLQRNGNEATWRVPEEAKKRRNPVGVADSGLAVARDIYRQKCAQCHGESGKGDGPEAAMYSVKPANFTDAGTMKGMSDGEIFYKMSQGRRPMPSFKNQLTEEQRWQLVQYLRTFATDPGSRPK